MKTISIPKPCHEDWEEMTPTARGKFCASCKKVVHDFSRGTYQEFHTKVVSSKEDLCGRVPANWLANAQFTRQSWRGRAFSRLRKFAVCLMLVFGVGIFGLPTEATAKMQEHVQEWVQSHISDDQGPVKTIRGRVYDTYEEDPASGAVVSIFAHGQWVTTVFANENGEFEAEIPEKIAKKGEITIEVAWVGRRFSNTYTGDFEGIVSLGVESLALDYPAVECVEIVDYNKFPYYTATVGPVMSLGGFQILERGSHTGYFSYPNRLQINYSPPGSSSRFQQGVEEVIFMNSSQVFKREF